MSCDFYLKVDYRERDLYLLLTKLIESKYSNLNIEISKTNLEIGDIVFLNNKHEIILIIERKTLNDLLSSIKDGRYENQSKRLLDYPLTNHKIMYLIEGNLALPGISSTDKDIILSSIVSINILKGFSLYRCLNKTESAQFVARILYKLIKEKNKISNENIINFSDESLETNESPSELHISSLKKMKKSNEITKDNIKICFLSQIPGVNEKTANAILNYYDNCNFDTLITNIRNDPNDLNNIKINNNNKFRKINKNIIENIINFLL